MSRKPSSITLRKMWFRNDKWMLMYNMRSIQKMSHIAYIYLYRVRIGKWLYKASSLCAWFCSSSDLLRWGHSVLIWKTWNSRLVLMWGFWWGLRSRSLKLCIMVMMTILQHGLECMTGFAIQGRESLEDDSCSGWPATSIFYENISAAQAMVDDWWRWRWQQRL